MKSFWADTEARALRLRGPAQIALTAWQRMKEAGLDPELCLLPAHAVGRVQIAAADLVQIVDSLLAAPRGTARLHLIELLGWSRELGFTLEQSARPFMLLIDSLQLDPALPGPRGEAAVAAVPPGPEEQAKADGRFRGWHLLYERLDLTMEAEGLPADLRRPLCRDLAEVYEELLVTLRDSHLLLAETPARWRAWADFLSDFDATYHYHVGPRRAGVAWVQPNRPAEWGLQGRLIAALAHPAGGPGSETVG